MKKIWLPVVVSYILPLVVLGAGLVPCGGKNEIMCDKDICFILKLIDNVTDWFVAISGIIMLILIIVGGIIITVSAGNASGKTKGRKFIATAIIGYMMIGLAWVVVDTFIKFFAVDPNWGVWNPFSCS